MSVAAPEPDPEHDGPLVVESLPAICQEFPNVFRWTQHFKMPDGELATVAHEFAPFEHWVECDEKHDKEWGKVRVGDSILAYRIDLSRGKPRPEGLWMNPARWTNHVYFDQRHLFDLSFACMPLFVELALYIMSWRAYRKTFEDAEPKGSRFLDFSWMTLGPLIVGVGARYVPLDDPFYRAKIAHSLSLRG